MTTAKRVLLIDDEDHIREVAQLSLETVGGWDVMEAGSGVEGLEVATRELPDGILLDVMMPDMDGPTTFAKLKADDVTRGIPVIFLTASVQPADRSRLAALGAAGVLSKPFNPLSLPQEVAQLLGWDG